VPITQRCAWMDGWTLLCIYVPVLLLDVGWKKVVAAAAAAGGFFGCGDDWGGGGYVGISAWCWDEDLLCRLAGPNQAGGEGVEFHS
jgi:hypothetical protein